MLDDNWEMINGPIAHQIEVLNAMNQINVLDGLVAYLLAHRGPNGDGRAPMPDEKMLCNLHHAGTLFLLAEPGCYRNIDVQVAKNGTIVHQPPRWQDVNGHMQLFFRELSSIWASGDAIDVSSYALWRINWVHPFRNGNGRTARAFAYACLCVRLGVALPGEVTVIDQIMGNRPQYEAVLKVADDSFKIDRRPDLAAMKEFLAQLLQNQMNSLASAFAQ